MVDGIFTFAKETLTGGLNWGLFRDTVEFMTYTIGKDNIEIPSVQIFDKILQAIVNTCVGTGTGAGEMLGRSLDASAFFYSQGLFYCLMSIDFVVAILLGLIAFEGGPNFISLFMNKIFKYGFWMFIFLNWRKLTKMIGDSFLQIGVYDQDVTFDYMMHPSKQITTGFNYAVEYFVFTIVGGDNWKTDRIVLNMVLSTLIGFFIFIAFFLIALNLFLTVAEFYICSALALVFIPFALFEKTERFASQTFNLVINFGVRLMVLGALIRMGSEFFGVNSAIQEFFRFKDAPHILVSMLCMALVLTYAYLCCEAPQIASSIVSGALNLNSNNAIMHGYGAMATTSSAIGTAAKVGGAVAGAAQRASDAAANGAGVLGTVRAFNNGITSGIAKGTIGGLEEGQAVFKAASGRSSGLERIGSDGKPEQQSNVTRDSNGNVVDTAANGPAGFMRNVWNNTVGNAGEKSNSNEGSGGNSGYQGPPKNSMSTVSGASKGGTGNFNKPMS